MGIIKGLRSFKSLTGVDNLGDSAACTQSTGTNRGGIPLRDVMRGCRERQRDHAKQPQKGAYSTVHDHSDKRHSTVHCSMQGS